MSINNKEISGLNISKVTAYIFLTLNLLLLVFSIFGLEITSRADRYWPNYIAIIMFFWIVIYSIYSTKLFKTLFTFSNGFILALLVFHISHIMLHFFGIYDFSRTFYSKDMGVWFYKSSWMIVISLACYGIGLSVACIGNKPKTFDCILLKKNSFLGQSVCWWYGVGLFVFSLIMLIWVFLTVGNIFSYSRRDIFGGVGDTRGFGLFLMFFPSSLVLLVIGARNTVQKVYSRLLAIMGLLFILFLGYRSVALFPMLIGVIIWVKLGRKLNKKFIAILLSFLIVAIPAVKIIRQIGAYNTITLSDISESAKDSSADEIFLELGAISGIIAYTMKWVPKDESFRYGKTYYLALKNSIPNIGFNIRESNRKLASNRNNGKYFLDNLSASDWFVFKYSKWMYNTGGGSGYSIIAEPYLNFGILGVILFFVLLGFCIGKLDTKNLLNSPITLLLSGVMMWPVMKLVRNDITTFFKPMLFSLIVMGGWRLLTFWKKYKKTT